MAYGSFEGLEVWKKTCRSAVRVYEVLKGLPTPTYFGSKPFWVGLRKSKDLHGTIGHTGISRNDQTNVAL